MNAIYPFQTQAVRDLAWACFAAPMLAFAASHSRDGLVDCRPQLTAPRRLWLEQLDRDDTPLQHHLQQRPSRRLGVYFEQLWHFFVAQDPLLELVAHNLPVSDGERTLGEFDCLYFCRQRRRHVHLELAVKFYLGQPPGAPGSEITWLGPDRHDRLDRKVAHLLEHQTQLSRTDAGAALLASLGIDSPLREVALKGYLFQPHGRPLPLPAGYPAAATTALWLRRRDLPAFQSPTGCVGFICLPRLRWLSPARSGPSEVLPDTAALAQVVAALPERDPQPVLLAAVDAGGRELQRFFLAPDDWPDGIAPPHGMG